MTLQTRACDQCGVELSDRSDVSACPACLLELGLHRWESQDPGDSESAAAREQVPPKFKAPKPGELASRFPQLEILDLIGHGGMGAVYKARQVRLDRLVALKIIVPDAAAEPGFAERFEREARSLAKLNHPHVVTVHDFGVADGIYYLIMEYVSGTDLRHLIQSKELSPESALAMIPQICDALQFAHDQGIVHRDIKPENILIDLQGNVKIADFGLAKLLERTSDYRTLTGTGQVVGTPHYMAPEQLERPLEVDHRADVYSLGVVFYEMLTGELPLGRFNRPSKSVQVDVRLDHVVLRALEREPGRRYQHVSEIGSEVKSLHGAAPATLLEPERLAQPAPEEFLISLIVVSATIPLVWFAIWWTATPWPLLAFCLAWLTLGCAVENAGGPLVWSMAAVCFLAMIGLIGFSVWLTKDAFPIAVLVPALVAWCMGLAIGQEEKKKRLAEREKQKDP
ncbi:MAG: serine/threonine protein kinase [Planctomycetes bacterium]|nr:serine/threonine protein kinase [Planctomycetota bacterium]MBL7041405.1 serine/threonine protein kinase [Pirellulaceae bacterium]